MVGTSETEPKRSWPIWAKLALIASLAANVVIVGIFAGHMLKPAKPADTAAMQVELILQLVPDHQRDFTKQHFAKLRPDLRATFSSRGETLRQILSAMRAEPFVPADLEAALADRRSQTGERREIVQTGLVGLLEQFPVEDREAFAVNLETRVENWRNRAAQ